MLQYDVALASRTGLPDSIYKTAFPEWSELRTRFSSPIAELNLIATLHEEQVHVIVQRADLATIQEALGDAAGPINTLRDLRKAIDASRARVNVCLGSRESGVHPVALALLEHHGFDLAEIRTCFPSPNEMERWLYAERADSEIRVGFFVSSVPSGAMEVTLNDSGIKLLSLDPASTLQMTGPPTFQTSVIKPGTYSCQADDEPPIQTIATTAVLAATDKVPDVYRITRALHEGKGLLGMGDNLAQLLPSLPFHEQARKFYEEKGLIVSKRPLRDRFFERIAYVLNNTWQLLAILGVLLASGTGLLAYRREHVKKSVGRRILSVRLEATVPDSVDQLRDLRDEIQDRVRRRWWQRGELGKRNWRYLHDLINERIAVSRDNLARAMVAEVRAVAGRRDLSEPARAARYDELETAIWQYFERGELEAAQHTMLLSAIERLSGRSQAPVHV